MSRSLVRIALVWLLAMGMVPCVAAAQLEGQTSQTVEDTRRLAREAFRRGVLAARAGRWDEALREFERSHELVPSAVTLLNLAGSQVNTGRLLEGYANYRRILHAPADAASHRARVEQVVVELESRIPRVRIVLVRASQADTLVMDGQLLAQAGENEPLRVDPGAHRVELRRPGKPAVTRSFDVHEGQELVLDLDEVCALCEAGRSALEGRARMVLDPQPPVASSNAATTMEAPPSAGGRPPSRALPYLAYGVGAAGLALLAITGPMALSADAELSRGCGRTARCSEHEVARADRLALAADVGIGVAVSGVLVGTIALWVQRRGERRLSVAPRASREGAGLVTQVGF